MVSVQHKLSALSSKDDKNIQSLLDTVSKIYAPAKVDVVRRACELAEPSTTGNSN